MQSEFDTLSAWTGVTASWFFPRQLWALGVVLGLFIGLAAESIAQTRYVTDELVITVRTGPSTDNAIVESLNTGDAVTVLEENVDAGYARVRTESGAEGWALTRYLVGTRVARDRLAEAERELSQARESVAGLRAQVTELTEQLGSVSARMEEAESAATTLNQELVDVRSVSANAITMRDQNESLRRRLNERDALVERLTTENATLSSRANREWFVLGAGVLIAGIVLGLVIPSLRRKRRLNW
jgi:SH3 domain protein